jgi:hypothetical protein
MRRAALVLTTMALVLLLASGAAFAVTKIGGPGPDALKGTDDRDLLEGGAAPTRCSGWAPATACRAAPVRTPSKAAPATTSRPAVRGVAGPH